MDPGQKLHLILTNPDELREAVDKDWPLAREIIRALRSPADHQVLFKDRTGQKILKYLRSRTADRETVRG